MTLHQGEVTIAGRCRHYINSSTPGRHDNNVKVWFFKPIIQNSNRSTRCEIWTPQNLDHYQESILVQVMALCRQGTSNCLSQCRPRFMSPYGVTRPHCVNSLAHGRCGSNLKNIMWNVSQEVNVTERLRQHYFWWWAGAISPMLTQIYLVIWRH